MTLKFTDTFLPLARHESTSKEAAKNLMKPSLQLTPFGQLFVGSQTCYLDIEQLCCLLMLGLGCNILLWHSLSLPYYDFASSVFSIEQTYCSWPVQSFVHSLMCFITKRCAILFKS